MLQVESHVHTDEVNETPWSVHPERPSEVVDAKGATIASFEVRHHLRGILANCDKNADLTVRAVNAYKKRGGADIRQLQDRITRWADSTFLIARQRTFYLSSTRKWVNTHVPPNLR